MSKLKGLSLPLLLLPVGCPPREDLEILSRDLAAMGIICAVGHAVPPPKAAYDPWRNQYLANAFLALAAQAAAALADPRGKVLAVTEVDLYANDLNFVLGMAESRGRTAVISLCRLGLGADRETRRRRALKEAVHELGHTLGLAHCADAECVMHFSNALVDTDRKGHRLCAVCERKLDAHRPARSP
jgi:archaemetzincin